MYNKLFSKIVTSSVWLAPTDHRIVWITFIALMDQDGFVPMASVANLAHTARVSPEAALEAVKSFESPDPHDPEQEFEGRRIERVLSGWQVLNAAKYREMATAEKVREQTRLRNQAYRTRKSDAKMTDRDASVTHQDANVTPSDHIQIRSDSEKDHIRDSGASKTTTDATSEPRPKRKSRTKASAVVPSEFHQAVITAYHELCPMLPAIARWTVERRDLLEARIRERCAEGRPADTPQYWRGFFENVAASDWLSGKSGNGWRADLQWLLNPNNFLKVIERRYANNINGKSPSTPSRNGSAGT